MADPPTCETRLIRIREVIVMTGLSRASVYRMIKKGEFPSQVKLSVRASAWVLGEVSAWVSSRVRARPARSDPDGMLPSPSPAATR